MEINLQELTLDQANLQFPGCLTNDLLESAAQNAIEPGYHKLALYHGRLLSRCYELSYMSWSIWEGGEWQDVAEVANFLQELLDTTTVNWR